MPTTSARVSFGLYALEIRLDSDVSSVTPLQPFAKLADLENSMGTSRPYASYEPDFWLLDGEYKFLPEVYTTVHVGMMSLAMSDALGAFTVDPVLTIDFSQVHTTEGLTLIFNVYTGDYCDDLTIAYYNSAGVLIRTDNYVPTGAEFSTHQAVSNFKKIVVTFRATSRPYRYLRLTAVDYGELITFAGTAIKACNVFEEVNQISSELPISTLDLEVYSNEAQFSILNPEGKYVALKERQPLYVYEVVDGVTYLIGNYYLDDWSNQTDTTYEFAASDMLGVLDGMPFRGGIWLDDGINVETLLENILGPIFVPYELDNLLVGTKVKGWLPQMPYREALQQIGFAVGASIHCTRSGAIRIYRSVIAGEQTTGTPITKAQKGVNQSLTLKPIVTKVQIVAHNYAPGGESEVIASGTYAVGTHEISFSEPMHALSVVGATIIESGVNYAVLSVAVAGTVVLTGLKYVDTQAVYTIETPNLNVSVRPNALNVEAATLVHNGNVAEVAARIYTYHQQRYLQKLKMFAPAIVPGEIVIIDALYNRQLRAVVETMESDLALGFTSKLELTGVDHALG